LGGVKKATAAPAEMDSCAVALPSVSNVTEFGLSEHVGEPACTGCTEQAKDTGLSNAFNKLRFTVDVALCPGLTVLGLTADAEIEKSAPTVFSKTLMVLSPVFVTTMSGDLSPLRSAVVTRFGEDPAVSAIAEL
jgi:hypothetical protein